MFINWKKRGPIAQFSIKLGRRGRKQLNQQHHSHLFYDASHLKRNFTSSLCFYFTLTFHFCVDIFITSVNDHFYSCSALLLCAQLCCWLRWLRLWRQRLELPRHSHQGPQSHWVWCVNHWWLHCHPAISPCHRPSAAPTSQVCSRERRTDVQLHHPWPQTGSELHYLPWRCVLFRNKKLGTLQRITRSSSTCLRFMRNNFPWILCVLLIFIFIFLQIIDVVSQYEMSSTSVQIHHRNRDWCLLAFLPVLAAVWHMGEVCPEGFLPETALHYMLYIVNGFIFDRNHEICDILKYMVPDWGGSLSEILMPILPESFTAWQSAFKANFSHLSFQITSISDIKPCRVNLHQWLNDDN